MKQLRQPKSAQAHDWLVANAWLWGAVLALLVAAVYWPTWNNGFVFDDRLDVVENPTLRSLDGLRSIWCDFGAVPQYYPLSYTSFWVEYQLWGLDPRSYHIVNLLLHGAAAILVWRVLTVLGVKGAWLAAALFAVHPVGVESVAWIAERKNLLSLVLALCSLLAYLRFDPLRSASEPPRHGMRSGSAWTWYALALGFFVAALLSKTATASLPAVLLIIFWWKHGRLSWRDVLPTVPFFAIGLGLAAITVWMETTHVQASGAEWDLWAGQPFAGGLLGWPLVLRSLIAGRALWFYIGKLAWPAHLIFFYPRWTVDAGEGWQYLFPLAALGLMGALWLARNRIGRGPLAAVLIFGGVLLPALGFFNVNLFRYSFVADHFQYHASITLFALAAGVAVAAGSRLPHQWEWVLPLAAAALLIPLVVVAHQRTYVYHDDISLDKDIVSLDPRSWDQETNPGVCYQQQRALYHIAADYRQRGEYEQARTCFERALDMRRRLAEFHADMDKYQDEVAEAHVDIGLTDRRLNRPADAADSFRQALAIREQLMHKHPAASEYQRGLAWCYLDLGFALSEMGAVHEAEAALRQAIAVREKLVRDNPANRDYQADLATSFADLGLALRKQGESPQTEAAFQRAVAVREGLAKSTDAGTENQTKLAASYEDLAISQRANGKLAEALATLRRSSEIQTQLAQASPGDAAQRDRLAATYVDMGALQTALGKPTEAAGSLQQAAKLREELASQHPADARYQDGLAWTYFHLAAARQQAGQFDEALALCRRAITLGERLLRDPRAQVNNRASLVPTLVLCGDVLALQGKWRESAELFAGAAGVGDGSWQTASRLAWVQKAAGMLPEYRATCEKLFAVDVSGVPADAVLLLVWPLLLDDRAADDAQRVLAFAQRVAEPSAPATAIVLEVAKWHAERGKQTADALTAAIARLNADSSSGSSPQQFASRLLSQLDLARANRRSFDQAAWQHQKETLNELIRLAPTATMQPSGNIPPWIIGCVVAIARHELSELDGTQ